MFEQMTNFTVGIFEIPKNAVAFPKIMKITKNLHEAHDKFLCHSDLSGARSYE